MGSLLQNDVACFRNMGYRRVKDPLPKAYQEISTRGYQHVPGRLWLIWGLTNWIKPQVQLLDRVI